MYYLLSKLQTQRKKITLSFNVIIKGNEKVHCMKRNSIFAIRIANRDPYPTIQKEKPKDGRRGIHHLIKNHIKLNHKQKYENQTTTITESNKTYLTENVTYSDHTQLCNYKRLVSEIKTLPRSISHSRTLSKVINEKKNYLGGNAKYIN